MAKITAADRRGTTNTITYPAGYVPGSCKCKGCSGGGGDCVQATIAVREVVTFALDDGRAGSVNVAPGASDAAVTAAISAWASAPANAKPAAPLVGTII